MSLGTIGHISLGVRTLTAQPEKKDHHGELT